MSSPLEPLVALAHADGGWGYVADQPAHLEPTCLALLALRRRPLFLGGADRVGVPRTQPARPRRPSARPRGRKATARSGVRRRRGELRQPHDPRPDDRADSGADGVDAIGAARPP